MTGESLDQEFEFDDGQNEILKDLAGKMVFVSLMMITLGFFVSLGGIGTLYLSVMEGFRTLVVGIFLCLFGIWTRKASQSFREIVVTEGRDITHLMNAMEQLRLMYGLQYWACLVAVVLTLIGLLLQVIS